MQYNIPISQKDLKIENERIEFEKRYDELYENYPDLLCLVDIYGIITNCNGSYAENVGYAKEEIIGQSIFKYVSSISKELIVNEFNQWSATLKKSTNVEIWIERKDGTIFPVLFNTTNIIYNNSVVGQTIFLRDISEINKLKKQIEEQTKKRLLVVGELSARLAHDLRNPLSVLKNTIPLIQLKNPILYENTSSDFIRMEHAITRMTHQVDEVLSYVKQKPVNLEKILLSTLLKFTIERLKIPDKIQLKFPQKDYEIFCDLEKMEVVFINLIINATQAMEEKGSISIAAYDEKEWINIEFSDTGPGIPPELLERVFEPLFTTKQVGTGLGLVSCKNIIENHKGTITVKSTESGTTFLIKIPKKVDLANTLQ